MQLHTPAVQYTHCSVLEMRQDSDQGMRWTVHLQMSLVPYAGPLR